MDDLLIENDEIGVDYTSVPKGSPSKVNKKEGKRFQESVKKSSTPNVCDTTPIKSFDTRISMMYTCPIIPDSPEVNASNAALPVPLAYKFTNGDFTDNIKCIVTAILFLSVIVMIVVVAIFKNPEM